MLFDHPTWFLFCLWQGWIREAGESSGNALTGFKSLLHLTGHGILDKLLKFSGAKFSSSVKQVRWCVRKIIVHRELFEYRRPLITSSNYSSHWPISILKVFSWIFWHLYLYHGSLSTSLSIPGSFIQQYLLNVYHMLSILLSTGVTETNIHSTVPILETYTG